ncbi:MAG: TIGR00282 family metallophosphoesterase [Oscillospiraceae bacterium]|nr:TIGR00282 family metallophosphoesterase [Clostridiales bacterium]MCI7574505.1 TIGR00282 family metallophosphoesterase [Clostridiales bacterium]MDD7674135.1 TIGR00282 family metallophosphoesterase [Oscillospiraceae bacterium]
MELRVLAVGDVVGNPGMERIRKSLRRLIRKTGADFTVVNGENASVVGLTPRQAEDILDAGADVITLGNHSFSKREIVPYLEDTDRILRPANYAPQTPGRGWAVYETRFGPIGVIDLIGRCNMDYGPDNPFLLAEKLLKKLDTRLILVELHAEATSEKLAMGYMLDGKVSAVWGTHTHVPTADIRVLPQGTGYITDLGMTGPRDSVLGIRPELSIARFRGDLPERYRWAEGETKLEGALFTIDAATGKCLKAERVETWD